MGSDAAETERVAVKTYIPAYQKAEWEAHATELDMSQSEFVRTMVQSGRRGFSINPESTADSDADPRGQPLEDRILDILRERGPQAWDELRAAVTEEIEDRLDETLANLQDQNRIRYSGRDGGYTLAGENT